MILAVMVEFRPKRTVTVRLLFYCALHVDVKAFKEMSSVYLQCFCNMLQKSLFSHFCAGK